MWTSSSCRHMAIRVSPAYFWEALRSASYAKQSGPYSPSDPVPACPNSARGVHTRGRLASRITKWIVAVPLSLGLFAMTTEEFSRAAFHRILRAGAVIGIKSDTLRGVVARRNNPTVAKDQQMPVARPPASYAEETWNPHRRSRKTYRATNCDKWLSSAAVLWKR